MSRSVNNLTLVGNVGAAPEIRSTLGGQTVAKFSLATTRSWTDGNGQKQERTEWHRITAFGKLADIVAKYVGKGDRLYLEGRVEYSETVGQDGVKRYFTDVIMQELIMLGSPSGARSEPVAAGVHGGIADRDDSLPF